MKKRGWWLIGLLALLVLLLGSGVYLLGKSHHLEQGAVAQPQATPQTIQLPKQASLGSPIGGPRLT